MSNNANRSLKHFCSILCLRWLLILIQWPLMAISNTIPAVSKSSYMVCWSVRQRPQLSQYTFWIFDSFFIQKIHKHSENSEKIQEKVRFGGLGVWGPFVL